MKANEKKIQVSNDSNNISACIYEQVVFYIVHFTNGSIGAIGSTNDTIGSTSSTTGSTNGTIGSTNGVIGCRYCSGFYGRQWYQWQPMAPMANQSENPERSLYLTDICPENRQLEQCERNKHT